jgi:uncharacterized protein (DUF1800 family)
LYEKSFFVPGFHTLYFLFINYIGKCPVKSKIKRANDPFFKNDDLFVRRILFKKSKGRTIRVVDVKPLRSVRRIVQLNRGLGCDFEISRNAFFDGPSGRINFINHIEKIEKELRASLFLGFTSLLEAPKLGTVSPDQRFLRTPYRLLSTLYQAKDNLPANQTEYTDRMVVTGTVVLWSKLKHARSICAGNFNFNASIKFRPKNFIPQVSNLTIDQVIENRELEFTLPSTGENPECFINSQPMQGEVKVTPGSCSAVYRPNSHFIGNDSFTFKSRVNGVESSNIGTVSIEVKSRKYEFAGNKNVFTKYRDTLTPNEINYLINKTSFCDPELKKKAQGKNLEEIADLIVNGYGNNAKIEKDAERISNNYKMSYNRQETRSNGERTFYQTPKVYDSLVSVQVEMLHLLRYSNHPFQEKIAMLLYNQLPADLSNPELNQNPSRFTYRKQYIDALRSFYSQDLYRYATAQNGLGAIGLYLDNFSNSAKSDIANLNINFGRELLELGILGKKDPITRVPNYEEDDGRAAARAARGFRELSEGRIPVPNFFDSQGRSPEAERFSTYIKLRPVFDPSAWTENPSSPERITLFKGTSNEISGHFKMDSLTPDDSLTQSIIDNHPGVARFIAGRFVTMLINPEPTEQIVQRAARALKDDRFVFKPFLKKLIMSSAMFADDSVSSGINSPVDLYTCTLRGFDLPITNVDTNNGDLHFILANGIGNAGQDIFAYPSIFGINEAGKNGDGIIHRGEEFITVSYLIEKQRGLITYLNRLDRKIREGGISFDWSTVFTSTSSSKTRAVDPVQAAEMLTEKIGVKLNSEQMQVLVEYLSTLRTRDRRTNSVSDVGLEWDNDFFSSSDVVKMKAAGAIEIMFSIVHSSLK